MPGKSSFKLTYSTMYNPPEELHSRFEEALDQLKSELGKDHGLLIDGQERFVAEKLEDRSPIDTEILLGTFQKGSSQDAQDALAAARKAFPMWSRTPWQDRVAMIRRAADIINERVFEMAAVLSMEVGKEPDGSTGRYRRSS